MSGYRGFLRELARTGTWRALALQVRAGAGHLLRRLAGRRGGDPIARFLAHYGADGFGLPDRERARLQLAAEACLACSLCSVECARAGGAPPCEPRDAVLSAVRLEIDWLRLGPDAHRAPPARGAAGGSSGRPAAAGAAAVPAAAAAGAARCSACAACEAVCPVGIPIAAIQVTLARLV
ncbi:MAG: hypothetical protein OZ948_19720 [Deltaproteobacteria bacterium]|nr:hypothetical protein [Deltaproteobacteria bacterium]